ncbi:cupin domain-containing protein [Blastococcus sp. BMG 814]|uniref:Cupin domain-containing protein n=1 Tax=Blastococcus carthaginiensis TaxID=3050034 RepID=A0ABT9IDI4_9ACTN|nr:cupin domain-containing protein [Blastococcus carthaginiensis]MDP5183618.1 cupin domain-containing protein [Blastococcus carthaginiensis]
MTSIPHGSRAADRLLAAAAMPLPGLPLDPAGVVAGAPAAGLRPLAEISGIEVGLWELTEGTVTDVEDDEIFVVLTGRGRLLFDDGSCLALVPGTVVRLGAGDRTTWEISETLRKLYLG